MNSRGSSGHLLRRAALFAALAAMILRALLPAGFMLEPGSGKIVICTGKGPLERPADDHAKKPLSTPDGPCLFAGHANAAPLPAPALIAFVAFPIRIETHLGRSETIAPGRGLAAPPPLAHAPPTLI